MYSTKRPCALGFDISMHPSFSGRQESRKAGRKEGRQADRQAGRQAGIASEEFADIQPPPPGLL